ncbi:transposase [Streptomyces rectiverticillatus]|nr:transposase [Streptomyces rectiverticillatus]
MVYFVLALCLFARESYEEVVRVLTGGIPGSRAVAWVNRSSLSRARETHSTALLLSAGGRSAFREGRTLPKETLYRVITFFKDGRVVYLGTTLLDHKRYPANELVGLYRERWEIELAFDEIKNHLGPGGPIRSRTPDGVRQELWAFLAVHHAVRRFALAAATAGPTVDADRVSYLRCVRVARRSVPAQAGAARFNLARAWNEAAQEARSRLLPLRRTRVPEDRWSTAKSAEQGVSEPELSGLGPVSAYRGHRSSMREPTHRSPCRQRRSDALGCPGRRCSSMGRGPRRRHPLPGHRQWLRKSVRSNRPGDCLARGECCRRKRPWPARHRTAQPVRRRRCARHQDCLHSHW